MADFSVLGLLGVFIYLITSDITTALIGAFGIYLLFGMLELKEYPVINKLGLITAIVYNIVFVMGLIDHFLPIQHFSLLNTTFAFSFWLILILGFAFFGRKYIIVWRFMSPQYLTLGLYLIAWLGVATIAAFQGQSAFYNYIYEVLIVVNFIVYFVSGPALGVIMGIKPNTDPELDKLVQEVADQMGISGKIKVGVGKYPIINAMAYGPFFDKRMGIICNDWRAIPPNELQGIIAHEMAHLRGNHTFILTIITSLDLVVRLFLGIPATYYDYIFNTIPSQHYPLLVFILVEIVIFLILYIFVRILEGKADRGVRAIGRGPDLAKALYNLEGFYAYGREIGLNTMLLCDEQIFPENQKMDYFTTAQYLSEYLIRPSTSGLLMNLLNSHPPSAIRIASMFNTSFGPYSESLMNFTLLGTKSREKFGRKMELARQEFDYQQTEQFLQRFGETSVVALCSNLNLQEDFQLIVGYQFLFSHKITKTLLFGTIEGIKFEENVGAPITFKVLQSNGTGAEVPANLQSNQDVVEVPASLYDKGAVQIGGTYDLRKYGPAQLQSISLSTDAKVAILHFMQSRETLLELTHKQIRLPLPLEWLNALQGKRVFLKKNGTYQHYICTHVEPGATFKEYCFHVAQVGGPQEEEVWDANAMEIFPRHFTLSIQNNKSIWATQLETLQYLQDEGTRVTLILKKPVNNEERGILVNISPGEGVDHLGTITIQNIHGIVREIPLKELDFVTFSSDTAAFEFRRDISFATKLMHKIIQRYTPARIFT